MAPRGMDASETELEVLKVLWDQGKGTVRDIEAELVRGGRRWAYTTIQTLLQRLHAKGLISIDKGVTPYVYTPAVSRDKLLRQRLKDLAHDVCDGMTAPLVQALVSQHRFSKEEIEHFRQLLDDLDPK